MKPRAFHLLLLSLSLQVAVGCASKRLTIGDETYQDMNGASFLPKLQGVARVYLISDNVQSACKKSKNLPQVSLEGDASGRKENAKVFCSPEKDAVVATFKSKIRPEVQTVSIKGNSTLSRPIGGYIAFDPIDRERFSDADKTSEGASSLKEGANEGVLSPGNADLTDWWKIESKDFARFSVVITQNGPKSAMTGEVFRERGGQMERVSTLVQDNARVIPVQGSAFFRIRGSVYGRNIEYSLSLKKLEGKGAGAQDVALPLSVIDHYPISGASSAVILNQGEATGLKVGDIIKLFDGANGKFIDGCELISVSSQESECQVNRVLSAESKISAKRSL